MKKAGGSLITPYEEAKAITSARRMTSENVAVFYIAGQQYGQDIAEYYQSARSIPISNVHGLSYDWDYLTDSASINMVSEGVNGKTWAMLVEMASYVKNNNIQAIVLAGYWPKLISNSAHDYTDKIVTLEDYVSAVQWTSKAQNYDEWCGAEIFSPEFRQDYTAALRAYRVSNYNIGSEVSGNDPFRQSYGDTIKRPSPWMRIALDFEDRIRAAAVTHSDVIDDADKFISYIVTRLTCSYVHVGDTDNVSALDVVKRMIDDSIWSEQQGWTDLPGKAFLSGTGNSNYFVSLPAQMALTDNDFNLDNIFWESMTVEGTFNNGGFVEPTPAVNYPPGYTSLAPTGVYTKVDDMFMNIVGSRTYYSSTYPYYNRDQIEFVRGGIAGHGQSYGARQSEAHSIDPFYGLRNLQVSSNGNRDAFGVVVKMYYDTDYGHTGTACYPFIIECTNTAPTTAATVEVTAENTIVLQEDTGSGLVTVATINITTDQTIIDIITEIQGALPSGWICNESANGAESRAMRAIKSGACLAFGSGDEPFTTYGYNSAGHIESLLVGDCVAEAMRKHLNSGVLVAAIGTFATLWPETIRYMCIYGDPLYRPFGSRE